MADIEFIEVDDSIPYQKFLELYKKASTKDQKNIDAICISSFNDDKKEVSSRYVNCKYLIQDKFIFFSNYKSPKSEDFKTFDQVSAIFYWNMIDVQIRMKCKIKKTTKIFSEQHFKKRSFEKNILAITSQQSSKISSYDAFLKKYNINLKNISKKNLKKPEFWGGYDLTPYVIELWQGHKDRINKRELFTKEADKWFSAYLQP